MAQERREKIRGLLEGVKVRAASSTQPTVIEITVNVAASGAARRITRRVPREGFLNGRSTGS